MPPHIFITSLFLWSDHHICLLWAQLLSHPLSLSLSHSLSHLTTHSLWATLDIREKTAQLPESSTDLWCFETCRDEGTVIEFPWILTCVLQSRHGVRIYIFDYRNQVLPCFQVKFAFHGKGQELRNLEGGSTAAPPDSKEAIQCASSMWSGCTYRLLSGNVFQARHTRPWGRPRSTRGNTYPI